jgi:serine/threonine protein kinase
MVPRQFGNYEIVSRLGVGGMAEVFEARTVGMDGFTKMVAIKRLTPAMADDDTRARALVDEARIAAQFHHENIVEIFDLGKKDDQYYIVMDLVRGRDLRQLLRRVATRGQTLSYDIVVFIVGQVCQALDYVHRLKAPNGRELGIVHRDVSPHNVMLSFEGAVKLTDFGIALASGRSVSTEAGVLKGKFCYMSPEQVRGDAVDHRADVFSLGILLWEMLTGKQLFAEDDSFATLTRIRGADVPSPRTLAPKIPKALEAITMRALSRRPEARFHWAGELGKTLDSFAAAKGLSPNREALANLMQELFADELAASAEQNREGTALPWQLELPDIVDLKPSITLTNIGATVNGGAPKRRMPPDFSFSTARTLAFVLRQPSSATASPTMPSCTKADRQPPRNAASRPPGLYPIRWPLPAAITAALLAATVLALFWPRPSPVGSVVLLTPAPQSDRLFFDGNLVDAASPAVLKDVEPGLHTVKFQSVDGSSMQMTVKVRRGEVETVEFKNEAVP